MALAVEKIGKDYATQSGPLTVLADVTFSLAPGEAMAVMGPSGSGKSTLLHIIGTLDNPTHGRVTLNDVDPFTLREPELAQFRNKNIGFVFQDHHLLPQCTVLENVLIPTLVSHEASSSQFEAEARRLLESVGLGGRIDHRPAELSGGERQRAAIARSLIHRPKLLLADEPTGNLDRKTAHAVGELLTELHQRENTILIVVTHSAELAAIFKRRGEMNDGCLVVTN